MKRTLKRELKVLEIAKREAVGSSTECAACRALESASVGAAGTRARGGNAALLYCGILRLKPVLCAVAPTEEERSPDADEMVPTDPS